MDIIRAKSHLDAIIDKARVHLYKPIQIAEILHRDRTVGDIDLAQLTTYRTHSKKWRDEICMKLLGRTSTSSAKYQDNLFDSNAIPPDVLVALGAFNKAKVGIIESYIYTRFKQRHHQMMNGLSYCLMADRTTFVLEDFLGLFEKEKGLKRSLDKIYEIVVYALFTAIVDALEIRVEVSINPSKADVLREFEDFAQRVVQLSINEYSAVLNARINRLGVTNAADRGLDMFANFGIAIQIKHLSLTEELAEDIVSSVSADRIVIVCKESEQKIIVSLLSQIGWKSRIQSIVTEADLIAWYEKAMRGKYSDVIGDNVLRVLSEEISLEFPSTQSGELEEFMTARGYREIEESDFQ